MLLDFYQRTSTSVMPSWTKAALFGAAGLAASAILVRYLSQRAESDHRPVGKFASLGTTQIHYVDRGSGPPVVVLHGNGNMIEELESSGLLRQLAQSHRVIALDRPGFGRSTDAFLRDYSVGIASRPSQLRSVADDTVDMPRAAARLSPRYGELQIPIDVIAGTDDKVVSTAHQSRRLNKELHNSYFDEVPGVGHMLHHAHPQLVVRRVADVIQRAGSPIRAKPSTVSPGARRS